MPGSALESRCHSHSLFGLLRTTAAKDTAVVAEPEVRIRVQVTDNQTQKRRSELRVRSWWSAQSNFNSSAISWPRRIFVSGSAAWNHDRDQREKSDG